MAEKETGKSGNDLPETKVSMKEEKEGYLSSFFGFDNLRSLAILIFVIFAFRWSVVSPYHVPTASMEPTIKVGDRLLAYKMAYNFKLPFTNIVLAEWSKPERGDIIVFRYPRDTSIDYVKRVIGVAGDRIQIIDDVLHINGEPQDINSHDFDRSILSDIEDYAEIKELYREKLGSVDHWVIQNKPAQRHFAAANWPPNGEPLTVPEDSVFVIGDNRDNSTDSRSWGEVPVSYIRGKAIFVIWSSYTPRDKSWPLFRWNRFGHLLQ